MEGKQMIVITITAFMKLPEKERFNVLKSIAKGDIKIIDLEQIAIESGVMTCQER